MNSENTFNLPNDFSKNLLDFGIPLNEHGINEIAWRYENVFDVIDILIQNKYSILGGDVYIIKGNEIESTYDNWYIEKSETDNQEAYLIKSRDKAISYIKNYNSNNNNPSIVFVLVYEKTV
jgi:hypothetical protein